MRKVLMLLLAVAVLATAAGAVVYRDYQNFIGQPLKLPQAGLTLNVQPGASIKTIAQDLQLRGVLDKPLYFEAYARIKHLARQIKVGEYALTAPLSSAQLLIMLTRGQVVQYSLTIVEGWTFRQMLGAIHNHSKLQPTLQGLNDTDIMARLGYPEQHPEGRFFPDTYLFPANTTDVQFLQRAYQAMTRQLAAAWTQRQENLPLQTPDDALILASIIEKETGQSSERREVAGVFIRRLRKNMLLQTDPTVIYGLGSTFDGNLRRRDLRKDTPYNTYTRKGLPPTPIALPGAASLLAAVDPAAGDTYYFVGKGDGTHIFSRTLREHNRAVRKYQLGQ